MALSVLYGNSTRTDPVLIVDEPIVYYVGTRIGELMEQITIPKRDNSFRDGSRGKGGKIKYRRK